VFRGLLLDLDDTLFDRGAAFRAWADDLAQDQLGRTLDPSELETLIAIDRRGHYPRAQFAAEALELGLRIDPAAFPFQLADYVVPEPAVRDTLETLGQTRRIALVTNGGDAQRIKLAKIGLEQIVQAVFVSSELGIAKPDPRIFERALTWTELPARDVMFIGDNPVTDLAPAAALGMRTGWRARSEWPDELPPPTFRIDNFGDLREACA
jgi:putative hydrolase of the HAD superfamily